jgi:hypothetical protein
MSAAIWIIVAVIAVPALYGLHRFCLMLDDYGYLLYRNKHRSSGGGSIFLPLDQFIRPQIQHVVQVEEQHEKVTEEKDCDREHQERANMP